MSVRGNVSAVVSLLGVIAGVVTTIITQSVPLGIVILVTMTLVASFIHETYVGKAKWAMRGVFATLGLSVFADNIVVISVLVVVMACCVVVFIRAHMRGEALPKSATT